MVEHVAYRNAGECAREHIMSNGIIWRKSFIATQVSGLVVSVSVLRLDCPHTHILQLVQVPRHASTSPAWAKPQESSLWTPVRQPEDCRLFLAFDG